MVSADPDSAWSAYQLGLLTCSYVFGELSHFLIGVTSRDIARDIHYGDQACFPDIGSNDNASSLLLLTESAAAAAATTTEGVKVDEEQEWIGCREVKNETR